MRLIATVSLLLAAIAAAETYDVKPASGSRFAFSVKKTGILSGKEHLFLFEKYRGSLEFNAAKPEASSIQLTIDSASVVCKDDWVSESELKSIMKSTLDDMLGVKRYPSITFTSTSIKPLGGNRYEAQGTLTIRDIPKPATVTVKLDAANPGALKLEGTSVVKLTDYKLEPPSALLGAIGTEDQMTLQFTIVASHAN